MTISNKFFAIVALMATVSSVVILKAEDGKKDYTTIDFGAKAVELKDQAILALSNIDTDALKGEMVAAEVQVEKLFTQNPAHIPGLMFLGAGASNYRKTNNASNYFTFKKHPELYEDKVATRNIEKLFQSSKDSFVKGCKAAGRRNMFAATVLLGGHAYYNHFAPLMKKKVSVVLQEDNKPTA